MLVFYVALGAFLLGGVFMIGANYLSKGKRI